MSKEVAQKANTSESNPPESVSMKTVAQEKSNEPMWTHGHISKAKGARKKNKM